MKRSRQGQVVIEYVTIAVLIMAGIMIIGPTVVRGINAFFQSATEGVQDSMTEEFVQGPEAGNRSGTCDCTPLVLGCGAGTCLPTEEYHTWTCNPPGCFADIGLVPGCTPNNSCCLRTVTGNCGINAETIRGGHQTSGSGLCPDGTMEIREVCGSNPVTYVCSDTLGALYPNPFPGCEYTCIGELAPNSDWCEGSYSIRLSSDMQIIYVNEGQCDPIGANLNKCKAYCTSGYVPAPTGEGCIPGPSTPPSSGG